jgi:hypothetical protein
LNAAADGGDPAAVGKVHQAVADAEAEARILASESTDSLVDAAVRTLEAAMVSGGPVAGAEAQQAVGDAEAQQTVGDAEAQQAVGDAEA